MVFLILMSCSSSKDASALPDSETYGYSKTNPIKVGGFANGPANERRFLNSLSGPDGEPIWYERSGSCCSFDTKNSPYGMGLLDIYRVTYQGKKDTVVLYLNMYDKAKTGVPKGFKAK